jgi:hypothetical protein
MFHFCREQRFMFNSLKDVSTALGIPNNLPPLSFRELRGYLWFGIAGLLPLTLGVYPHSAAVRWTVACLAVVWIIAPARRLFKRPVPGAQTDNCKAMRAQIRLYTFVVVALSVGFAFWARRLGIAWPVVIGALFVIDAFANLIASLTEWWRLSMLGHSLGLMICGFSFPFVDRSMWGILVGGAVLAGSLLASGILYWQVRCHNASPVE